MAHQVKVTSIERLETFRAATIIFLTKSHRSVDEVGEAIRRTRLWLQNDQRLHWEGELRKRRKVLDQFEQELLSAKLSGLRDSAPLQEKNVKKAKEAVAEAEQKLRNVKRWNRDFEHTIEPLVKKLDGMRQYLDHDVPRALAYLLQAQKTLEAYTQAGFESVQAPAPPVEAGQSGAGEATAPVED